MERMPLRYSCRRRARTILRSGVAVYTRSPVQTALHIEGVDCPLSPTGDECAPTRASPSYMAGTIIHLSGNDVAHDYNKMHGRAPLDFPDYSRKEPEQQLRDSEARARTYEVQMGMYDYDRRGYTGRHGVLGALLPGHELRTRPV